MATQNPDNVRNNRRLVPPVNKIEYDKVPQIVPDLNVLDQFKESLAAKARIDSKVNTIDVFPDMTLSTMYVKRCCVKELDNYDIKQHLLLSICSDCVLNDSSLRNY